MTDDTTPTTAKAPAGTPHRIVVLGGGFGGIYTALRLQKKLKGRDDVQVTLISRDNYFLMTPLLFEAGSGILEPRHAVNPIRPLFKRVQFVEGEITRVDFEEKNVISVLSNGDEYTTPFDELVVALGSITNTSLVPGSNNAFTFKTMGDAIHVRNHLIDCFERADVELDPKRKQALMTIVVVGGGLVGVELIGEFTEFVANVTRHYRNVPEGAEQFILIEAGDRLMAEMSEDLSSYAKGILQSRGVIVRNGVRVKAMARGKVIVSDTETIEAETIVISTGVKPSPLIAHFPLAKDRRGRIAVDGTMRSTSHPYVWALGDCAAVPDPSVPDKFYPPLAQHAIREARLLADNILCAMEGKPTQVFKYESKGTLASLGQFKGVGKVYKFKIKGFIAWWVWRSYYLMQMPRINRQIRIMLDWTITLFFKNDLVKMDVACRPPGDPPEPRPQEEARIEDPTRERANGSDGRPQQSQVPAANG
ncbi:MAG TPA: NAD(P)/FAD-dependent oxidoreductase [Tepidisphaeraceae bacterium]|jgi:NADH dehydrogenase|nr:NAD(P)/FAD-dependent oxidoreductase [Tepidisphaeraceae bacterium]